MKELMDQFKLPDSQRSRLRLRKACVRALAEKELNLIERVDLAAKIYGQMWMDGK